MEEFISNKIKIGYLPLRVSHRGIERGVFAIHDLQAGEVVENAPVVIFPFQKDIMDHPDNSLRSAAENIILSHHYWGPWHDSTATCMALGYASLYNHNDPANIKINKNGDYNIISFITTRPVKVGEELCHDYREVVKINAIFSEGNANE
jgi:SET domain-containing protein